MGVVAVSALGALAIATGVAGAAGTLFQPYQAFATGSWPEAVAIGSKGLGFLTRIGARVVSQAVQIGDRPQLDKLVGPVKVVLDA